jgi:hypothetical protein
VGADADVPQLVGAALRLSRSDAPEVTVLATRDTAGEDETTKLAMLALVQLGYPVPVNAATAHVGGRELETLIEAALQRTGS